MASGSPATPTALIEICPIHLESESTVILAIVLAAIAGLVALVLFARSKTLSDAEISIVKIGAVGLIVLTVVAVAATGLKIVSPGHVAVATLFGSVQQRVFDEGLHIVNPLFRFQEYSIRRTMFDFRGRAGAHGRAGEEIVAVSSDSTPLTMDVGFPIRLNGTLAWKVFQRIGHPTVVADQLIVPAARAAVRDAVAGFTWRDAATISREKLASGIEARFRHLVERDLVAAGFAENEANTVFTIQPVQLRKILPPQKVLNAVSEKVAAEEDLERQRTLTQIAEEEARRRQNEGRGVSNLFAELPKEFTPTQIRAVLGAIADKVRAEAMMKAVETGQVRVMVMQGGQPAVPVVNPPLHAPPSYSGPPVR